MIEKLGVTELKDFEIRSPGTILKMILVSANVVREKLVDKIKQSDGYACLTDELTDISNICNLLTFICFFDISNISIGKKITSFANTTDILEHSESISADSESIFWCLKQVIEDICWIFLR